MTAYGTPSERMISLTLQEFYAVVGGDYQDALNRMMMESMLRKFLMKFPTDPSFTTLE